MNKQTKIPKPYFKYVEFELYNYDETIRQLNEIKEDLYNTTSAQPFDSISIQHSDISKPVERKVMDLISTSSVAIVKMERTIRAIQRALLQLDEEHNEIFELKYRQGKNWRQVLSEMCISERSYFYKRKELIFMVALQLGLAD